MQRLLRGDKMALKIFVDFLFPLCGTDEEARHQGERRKIQLFEWRSSATSFEFLAFPDVEQACGVYPAPDAGHGCTFL